MISAWALLVVSSEAQAETIANQRAWAAETAKERGWAVEREFAGVSSGKDGPRKLLRDLITALREIPEGRRPKWLLMIRADRVGRGRLVESQVALHEIADLGVRIWTRDAGEVKLDSATDQIIAAVKAGLATLENEVRRDKLLANYRRKRAAGLPICNRRPYGLALGANKFDVAVPELSDAVKLAFEMRAAGETYYGIAKKLLDVAPPYRFKNGEMDVRWTSARVKRLLTNRSYIGPIVDELLFARAQRNVAAERLPRKNVWELSSAPLRCYCGRGMGGNYTKNVRGGYRYYRCAAAWNHDGWGRSVRADGLEQQFLEKIREIAAKPTFIDDSIAASAPSSALLGRALPAAKRKLDDLDRQRTRIWELHAAGKLSNEHLQPRLDELTVQRDVLVHQIEEMSSQHALATNSRRIARGVRAEIVRAAVQYEQATPAERRQLVRIIMPHLGGGLCAEADGSLTFRVPEQVIQNRAAQFRDFA